MATSQPDRLDRIEALLEGFVAASVADRKASDERMTRIEAGMVSSNDRLTRIEENMVSSNDRLTRIEQAVESNNRFLESFSVDLRRYTDSMYSLTNRLDGIIAVNNQERFETNSRLGRIQSDVSAIAKHLGIR